MPLHRLYEWCSLYDNKILLHGHLCGQKLECVLRIYFEWGYYNLKINITFYGSARTIQKFGF